MEAYLTVIGCKICCVACLHDSQVAAAVRHAVSEEKPVARNQRHVTMTVSCGAFGRLHIHEQLHVLFGTAALQGLP
jgi:hypothetical protein